MKKDALKIAAQIVKSHGKRKDTVLAHINPSEARFLKEHFGQDINSKTGLPQYGLFKSIGHAFRSPFKSASKIFRKAAPIAGAVVGNMLAPGVGSVIGGAVGKAVTSRHGKDLGRNLLKGGLTGAVLNYALPQLGGAIGAAPGSALGNMMMVTQQPSLLNSLGLPNLVGGGIGGPTAQSGSFGGGPSSSLLGGLMGNSGSPNLLTLGAMGAMLQGARKGKSSYLPYEGPTVQQRMLSEGLTPPTVVPYISPKPIQEQLRTAQSAVFKPELMEPEYFEPLPFPGQYKEGGIVDNEYMHGSSGGQADDRKVKMPPKTYVMDATTISLYGDGNSAAGKKELDKLKNKFIKAALDHGYQKPPKEKLLDALLSDGEDVWPPEAIYGAGLMMRGKPEEGNKVMDDFRKNLRKQKGIKHFLPPKSKSAAYYLRG